MSNYCPLLFTTQQSPLYERNACRFCGENFKVKKTINIYDPNQKQTAAKMVDD
jgi:hypothetical protein